jgi:hypothetical protein
LFASTKSAPIQQQIGTATQQRATNQGQAQQSVSDFVKEFLASKGQSQQAANEESAAIAGIYGSGPNSVQSQLARLNAQRTAAINQGAQSAMARAIRANNIRRMQSGNSSYLDRLLAQDLAGIGATAAGQAADQGRADLQYLTGLRTGNVGRQQEIIDRILSRNLMPVQATADVEALNLRNLASLSNLDQSNTVYERPEDAYLNRANFYDLLRRRALY